MKKILKNFIRIEDWTGKCLFEGHCEDPEVLRIMQLNEVPNDDIFVCWQDENDTRNVYEYIYF